MGDSILDTVKKLLGLESSYDRFDTDVIVCINNALFTLKQLGIGNKDFFVSNSNQGWSDFVEDFTILGTVQAYVANRVKLLFDPPTSSFVLDSIKNQMSELEWRLDVYRDEKQQKEGVTTNASF